MLTRRFLKLKYYFSRFLLNWLILFSILCSMVWSVHKIITWICSFYYNSLSYVIVTGDRYFTLDDDIFSLISRLEMLDTFVNQDVNVIQREIKTLSWIKQVSVRKQWPNVFKIHIVEYVPMAYWNNTSIISTTGIIFKLPSRFDSTHNINVMPILYGPPGTEQEVWNNYLIFDAILKKSSVNFQLKSITLDMYHTWKLVLKDGTKLILGRNNLIERLCYFLVIYPIFLQKIDEQNQQYIIDYIDLRYSSGCAVRWIHHAKEIVLCNKQVM